VGVHAHAILEQFYKAPDTALPIIAKDYWFNFLEEAKLGFIRRLLDDYRREYAQLKFRASKDYRGPDAIRTSSGKCRRIWR
jgi:hypothetical protein